MTAIVHGWCGFVEKSNHVVFQQMVLNKLWIPDVLIDIIKDFLYINAAEVLRKFYRFNLNRTITSLESVSNYMCDVYGRRRIAHWATGHSETDGDAQFQDLMCVTCGDFTDMHDTATGCCALEFDEENEVLHLISDDESNPDIDDVTETIPEVTWEVDIQGSQFVYAHAQQAQFIQNALRQAREDAERDRIESELWGREPEHFDDYDRESEAADYAEYMREVEMEYLNRGRR
jgi:hypothetical protein